MPPNNELSLNVHQLIVLKTLKRRIASPSHLARLVKVTAASMTGTKKKLIALGYVEEITDSDSRRKPIRITRSGSLALARVLRLLNARLEK